MNWSCKRASQSLALPVVTTVSAFPFRVLDEVLKDCEDDRMAHDGEVRMVHDGEVPMVHAGEGKGDVRLRRHTRASEQRNIGRLGLSSGYIIE